MNNVELSGRLTKEVDVKHIGDTSVAKFNLAVDRKFKKDNEPTADFINCVAFGKTADFIEKYFSKGSKIIVTRGRIQTGSYTNKDNQKVYTTDVVVEEVEFGESKTERIDNAVKANNEAFVPVSDAIDEELPFR